MSVALLDLVRRNRPHESYTLRRLAWAFLGAVLSSALLMVSVVALAADPQPVPEFSDGHATVGAVAKKDGGAKKRKAKGVGSSKLVKSGTQSVSVTPPPRMAYTVGCAKETGGNVFLTVGCTQRSADLCGSPAARALGVQVDAAAGATPLTNEICLGGTPAAAAGGPPAQQAAAVVEEVALSAAAFRKLPIPPAVLHTENNGFALRNAETNIYARNKTHELTTTVLGKAVRVRAIPVEYVFAYGDGATLKTKEPGGPVPEGSEPWVTKTATSHQYKETGKLSAGLVTTYRGEYSVDGGPFEPVEGTASVASAPIVVDVWRTRHYLVSTDCLAKPDAVACNGPEEPATDEGGRR